MDSIQNRQYYLADCPFCNQHTLDVVSWEEHLNGVGLTSCIEHYADRYCNACKRYADDLDMEMAKKRLERHQKRITHQRKQKRMKRRGYHRWFTRMQLRMLNRDVAAFDELLDNPDYLPF